MLENRKKWCQEKVEKGKEWIDDHKFQIGYGVGYYVVAKIFEPKKSSIDTKPIDNGDEHGFAIRTSGVDRFGRGTDFGPWVYCYDKNDRDHIMNNIDAAIRNEKGQRYED